MKKVIIGLINLNKLTHIPDIKFTKDLIDYIKKNGNITMLITKGFYVIEVREGSLLFVFLLHSFFCYK